MDALQNINALVAENRISEALGMLNKLIDNEGGNASTLFLRGKLLWRLGDRHSAMGDYARAAELDPSGPATMALDNAREIDNFYNHDLYNP